MEGTLEHHFDEVPLVTKSGFDAGLISGMASISYTAEGEWSVDAIYLDGYRERSQHERKKILAEGNKPTFFERKHVCLDPDDACEGHIYRLIHSHLERDPRGNIQESVREAIAADREAAADDHADHKRNMRESV